MILVHRSIAMPRVSGIEVPNSLEKLFSLRSAPISEIENGRFTGSFDIFERLLNAVDLQFEVVEKIHQLPSWDEIEELFAEDDDD